MHLVKTAQKFVKENINISTCPTESKFYIDEAKKKTAEEKFDKSKKNIVIGAGSSGPSTKWGERNYINLINKINEKDNYFFYILCGPDESEISDKIINSLNKKNCISLSKKKIGELIPILSLCDIYIGNDSFGHHVTSQCGIPSIIIILDTPGAYTEYSINQHRIVPKGEDINLIEHDTRIHPDQIKVNQVYEKFLSLLK